MLQHLTRLFVDHSCYGCGNALTIQESHLCLSCLNNIQQTDFHTHPTENELFYRLAGRVPLAGATSLFYFDKKGRLQHIIEQVKYKHAPDLGFFLGSHFAKILDESPFMEGIEAIVPVPLHRNRQLTRGYNQAERMAAGMGKVLGIPVLNGLVKRTRHTITQTQKVGAARYDNVADAFQATGDVPANILVLDDVITTGATLEACIRALFNASTPPQSVKIAGIGMTRKN